MKILMIGMWCIGISFLFGNYTLPKVFNALSFDNSQVMDIQTHVKLNGLEDTVFFTRGFDFSGIDQAKFSLVNTSEEDLNFAVVGATFQKEEGTEPILSYYLYSEKDGSELESHNISLPAGSALIFRISFPPIFYLPASGEMIGVEIVLSSHNQHLSAKSKISVVEEW